MKVFLECAVKGVYCCCVACNLEFSLLNLGVKDGILYGEGVAMVGLHNLFSCLGGFLNGFAQQWRFLRFLAFAAVAHRYEDKQRKQTQQVRDTAENLLNQARRARKKLKDEDKTRLDSSVSALEDALRSGDEYRIRTASEEMDTILRSVGTYTSAPEGENDDGAYDA